VSAKSNALLSFEDQAAISLVAAATPDEFKLPFSSRIPRFISDRKGFFSAMSKEAGN